MKPQVKPIQVSIYLIRMMKNLNKVPSLLSVRRGKPNTEHQSKLRLKNAVVYKKWGGNEVKIGDVEYQFLKFEDILAIIK